MDNLNETDVGPLRGQKVIPGCRRAGSAARAEREHRNPKARLGERVTEVHVVPFGPITEKEEPGSTAEVDSAMG